MINALHTQLAAEQLRAAWTNGKRIALFLDYDGTLREIEREPGDATPTPVIRALLDELQARPNIALFLVSGRSQRDLDLFFPAPDFTIVAEHGAAVRRAGGREWQRWDRDITYAWKNDIRELFHLYEETTPGSFVEEKRTSLVWHFRMADSEIGVWKANQLMHELGTMLANEPVKIRHGRKIIEITSSEVSKAVAIRHLLHEQEHDIVLCAGDDQTDESMLEIDEPHFISIKIGPEPSRALYRLPDPAAFRTFLRDALVTR
ncbi:MAG: trehalose-phosphatase [Chthoniobacterales bacterium]